MGYTYIVFDFDGTLADSITVQNKILNELALKHHLNDIGPETFKNRDKLTLRQKTQMLSIALKFQSEFKALYSENISNVKPFDGILPLISLLRKLGYEIAIISSNAEENIEKFLKSNNIVSGISITPSKGLFGKHKALTEFMKRNRCGARDILYVGDEIRDVEACNKSGIDIAFVKWGLDADKDISSYAIKFIASSPLQLQYFLITA